MKKTKNQHKNSKKRNKGESKKDREPNKNAGSNNHYKKKPKLPRPDYFGIHAVREAWLNPERNVHALYITEQCLLGFEEIINSAQANGIQRPKPTILNKDQIDRLCPRDAVHQGIALHADPLPDVFLSDITIKAQSKKRSVILILDQVTDPHNVGAILRSASAFGADAVVMQTRHAPTLSGVLAKTACGAVDHIPVIHETNLSRAIEKLQEERYTVYGLDEHAEASIENTPIHEKAVLILGAEGPGMRRLLKEKCDITLRLPTSGAIASLNVSNAAAVALYAFLKAQRQ